MGPRRNRSLACRMLVAAFALWLPAATGAGGKATCIAASSLARSLETPDHAHLSCHNTGGDKDCCCKGRTQLRAAACGCHDGAPAFGETAHDPMVAVWASLDRVRALESNEAVAATERFRGRAGDGPEPPPPDSILLVRA
jgi:hypothetical protein